MNAAKPCAACKHVEYCADEGVHACLHPKVAVPSALNPDRMIGVNVSAVRFKAFSLGVRQCGPDALWFEERPAQDPMRSTS